MSTIGAAPAGTLPGPVLEALERLVPDARPFRRVATVPGGFRNRSYRVASRCGELFVRWRPPSASPALATPVAEAEVQALVARAGLAPPLLGFDTTARVMVCEYLGMAEPWCASDAHRESSVSALAMLLRDLHRLTPPTCLEPYRPRAIADRYVAALTREQRSRAAGRIAELERAAHAYERRGGVAVLCHNDLVADNVLDDGDRLWLVDFEYAARSAPILDLAGAAALNGYDRRCQRVLLETYYAPELVPFAADLWRETMRMVLLIAYVWSLAGEPQAHEAVERQRLTVDVERLLRAI